MIPSKYQSAVYDHSANSTKNLVVDAVAGSGKTTTIREAAKFLKGNGMFVAFNKHIAEELQKKLPYNVRACTVNSFGWQTCLREISGISRQVEKDKTEKITKGFFDMNTKEGRSDFYSVKGTVKRAVSLLKANCILPEYARNEVSPLMENQGNDPLTPETVELIGNVYEKCLRFTTLCDFDDQVFFPWYLDLKTPKVDFTIADEVQDFSPIQHELFLKMGRRLMGVGDERQAIYGFRGADPESIKTLRRRIDADMLPLSICYRCAKNIVKEAQKIVRHIEFADSAPDGIVDTKKLADFRKEVVDGDYGLCRTTAPLVTECLYMIREGRKATVKGRDIGEQLIALVDKIAKSGFQNYGAVADRLPIADFVQLLDKYRSEQVARLTAAEREDEIAALTDRVETIYAILESCDTVADIKNKIDQIFSDDTRSGIIFCTVHKSKGLEAPKVYILEPKLMPHTAAKQEWQKKQEMNIKYVAITRAMRELYWVEK